jgi:hypothetical protein
MRAPRVPVRLSSIAAAAACLLAGCVVKVDSDGYKAREEKRFRVAGEPDVRLATFDGPISVRGWDRDEVYIEVEKRGRDRAEVEAIEVVADQSGDQISIEARQPGAKKYAFGVVTTRSRAAKIVASVPSGSNVVLRTGDGMLSIERVKGRIELRSNDGNVQGLDLTGDVFAQTDDGAIRLEGVDGRCDVATGDGSIAIQGRLDGLRARTSDGSVVVKLLPGTRVNSEWSLSSGEGQMVLYVPDGLSASIDAETGDGRARVDPGLSFSSSPDLPRGILRGALGGGGQLVRLRTQDGPIALKRLPSKMAPGAPLPPLPPHPSAPPVER